MHDKSVGYSLSEDDIRKYLNGNTKIIPYTKIYNYKTIEELLEPYGHVFLLYLTKPNYGHWTLIFKYPNKNEIHFFDSYGYKPDTEFSFVKNDSFRKQSKQVFHYLVDLLMKAYNNYTISYNNFKLQSHSSNKKSISTCGRWCLARWINNDLNEYEFYQLFGGNSNIDKDELVTKSIQI